MVTSKKKKKKRALIMKSLGEVSANILRHYTRANTQTLTASMSNRSATKKTLLEVKTELN